MYVAQIASTLHDIVVDSSLACYDMDAQMQKINLSKITIKLNETTTVSITHRQGDQIVCEFN